MPIFTGPTANVVQCEMHGLVAAGGSTPRPSISIWHYQASAPPSVFSQAHVEAAFQTAICIPVTNALNLRYAQTFNIVRNICDATQLGTQVSRALPGAIAGDAKPLTDSAFILFRSTLRGKSYRGNRKLFPLSAADSTTPNGDVFNAAAITRFTAIITAYLAGFTDSDGNIWLPTVLARKLSKLKTNTTTVFVSQVATGLLNKRIGDMKKRKVASVY